MEKQSVEDSFRNAFAEAEVRPSADVWTHIELGIEKEEGKELKKRIVFYRWMAAASVVLAVSMVGAGYLMNTNIQHAIAINSQPEALPEGTEAISEITKESDPVHVNPSLTESNRDTQNNQSAHPPVGNSASRRDRQPKNQKVSTTNTIASLNPTTENKDDVSEVIFPVEKSAVSPNQTGRKQSPLPPLVVQRPYRIYFPKTEPDQIDLLLAEIEMEENRVKKKGKERKETLWTSVGMAAGSYNPVIASSISSNSPVFAMSGDGSLVNTRVMNLSNQVEASGSSFSSGLSIGGKVSDRWVLQGGVSYLTQNSSYTSNTILVDGANKFQLASINTIGSESYSDFVQSSPYVVSNTLKYFNIPLQAGYLIINKAFSWQLQGGISTDLFLQNTLSAEDAGLDKVSQSVGDDSPYRTVNFSGLLGTEVSYRFGEHYRIAINPGLRYPLQSVYKSELGVSAVPITFDLGLKFHYIFR